MNSTYPKDGKQRRQSQNYVPSGQLFEVRYRLTCHMAKATAIAEHYGKVSDINDGTYGVRPPDYKWQKRKAVPQRQVIKVRRSRGFESEIYVVSDQEGHSKLHSELVRWKYGGSEFASRRVNMFGLGRMWSFHPTIEEEDDEPITTNRPPIVKRLTGKERKIAKKRAAEGIVNKLNEE